MTAPAGWLAALTTGAVPSEVGPGDASVARSGCGICPRPDRAVFEVAGGDRFTFLQRILTASIQPRGEGAGRRALLLDNKGRIQADLDLIESGDRLIVLTAASSAAATIENLTRFVMRADVRIEPRPETVLALVGPGVSPVLGLEDDDAARPSGQEVTLGGEACRVVRSSVLPQGAEILAGAPERVADTLMQAGATPVGGAILETLRVEAGVPGPETELADQPFPQEVGLVETVDFEKGCYLGQETVARIHYRGHVNRVLAGVAFTGDTGDTDLRLDGRSVGRVTSRASSDRFGVIGLAMIRAEAAVPGQQLEAAAGDTGTGTPVRVVELPFA